MTVLGIIMSLVGIVCALVSERWLYRLFVFWTLFSATSIVNFGEADNGSALQVWMFFGFLWLIRILVNRLPALSIRVDRQMAWSCSLLTVFLLVAAASLLMPMFINGRLLIDSPHLGDTSSTPLYLSAHNVTQLLYLIFGGVITMCVAHANCAEEERSETECIIFWSATFVALWGLFQFACNVTGIPYPAFLFNNSGSASALGYAQTLGRVGLGRISSVAVEPSMFAQSIITLLPLSLPAWLGRGAVISIRVDRICSLIILIAVLLSTSSTAYLGLGLLVLVSVPILVRTRTMSLATGLWIASSMLAVMLIAGVVLILTVPVVHEVLDAALVNKSSSGSALERIMTIALAFEYFTKYPILGIGWGSATSHDVIVKLLSNTGILGASSFFVAMGYVIRSNWRKLAPLRNPLDNSRSAWLIALLVFLVISIPIEFPLAFGNFWLILGMAIAISRDKDPQRPTPVRLQSAE